MNLVIAYFLSNRRIYKKYYTRLMYVGVVVRQIGDILGTQCRLALGLAGEVAPLLHL